MDMERIIALDNSLQEKAAAGAFADCCDFCIHGLDLTFLALRAFGSQAFQREMTRD